MKVEVTLVVDVNDLDIDFTRNYNSITSEYWGNVRTDSWTEIDIQSIMYQDEEVTVSDEVYDELVEYLSSKEY